MLSGPVGTPSPSGNGNAAPEVGIGIVGGDDVPSKPVYPGIDARIAATAVGLNGPYGEDVASTPPRDVNPKCPGVGPDALRCEDGDLLPADGERDRESALLW